MPVAGRARAEGVHIVGDSRSTMASGGLVDPILDEVLGLAPALNPTSFARPPPLGSSFWPENEQMIAPRGARGAIEALEEPHRELTLTGPRRRVVRWNGGVGMAPTLTARAIQKVPPISRP